MSLSTIMLLSSGIVKKAGNYIQPLILMIIFILATYFYRNKFNYPVCQGQTPLALAQSSS